MQQSSSFLVSVVIPTYRRPALLRRCLSTLCRQTLPTGRYEIVVVDDGLDPETEREVQSWA